MAAVSEPVPIASKMVSTGSGMNLSSPPTAIEPATPILNGQHMAVLETIPKHKGESEFRTLFELPNATLLDGTFIFALTHQYPLSTGLKGVVLGGKPAAQSDPEVQGEIAEFPPSFVVSAIQTLRVSSANAVFYLCMTSILGCASTEVVIVAWAFVHKFVCYLLLLRSVWAKDIGT